MTITLAPGHKVGNELRLLDRVIAGLFDLDGVLTNTAAVHDKAWKKMLDSYQYQGVEVFSGSWRYLEASREPELSRVVVFSSANNAQVLRVTGLADLVEGWIDGLAVAAQGLQGEPAPDSFLAGARCVGVEPAQAAIFEDALAGVTAGWAGRFAFVVGVDRSGEAEALREHGADIARSDLAETLGGASGRTAR